MTVRLLKVIVQAVLVEDDGDTLRERVCDPATVHAAELDAYPARLAEQIRELN